MLNPRKGTFPTKKEGHATAKKLATSQKKKESQLLCFPLAFPAKPPKSWHLLTKKDRKRDTDTPMNKKKDMAFPDGLDAKAPPQALPQHPGTGAPPKHSVFRPAPDCAPPACCPLRFFLSPVWAPAKYMWVNPQPGFWPSLGARKSVCQNRWEKMVETCGYDGMRLKIKPSGTRPEVLVFDSIQGKPFGSYHSFSCGCSCGVHSQALLPKETGWRGLSQGSCSQTPRISRSEL